MRRYTHSSEAAKEKSDMPLHVSIEQVSCSACVCVCACAPPLPCHFFHIKQWCGGFLLVAGWGLHPTAVDVSLIPSLSRPGHRWQVGTKNIVPPPPHISTVVTDSVHLLLLTGLYVVLNLHSRQFCIETFGLKTKT